MTTPELAE
jgi:hypothetical protein